MTSLEQRYGGLAPKGTPQPNAAIDLMLRHRSVRHFDGRPLPEGMLELLIAAGQSGATSSNMQTATVIAVEDRERRAQLAAYAGQDFLRDVPTILCFVADQSRAALIGERRGEDYFSLPMIDKFISALGDCVIFGENVALAAESMGLGTCFIGNLRSQPLKIADMLALPKRAFVAFGLCLGHEKAGRPTGVRPRLPQGIVLHREKYDTANEEKWLAAYDQVVAGHEAEQGRSVGGWTERHPDRFASWEYLRGREKLREQLVQRGFPLD